MPVTAHDDDDNECRIELVLAREADTEALGAALAGALEPGLKIHLEGDLGAGKTTLTRAVLRALDFKGSVKSPTYTLIEPYTISRLNLYHFDFYRFTDPDEFLEAGLDEYFGGDGVCVVEWPGRAAPHLPPPDLRILLRIEGTGRHVEARGLSPRGQECLRKIREMVNP
ncbi:MAG: tRNA (adenosine(37)-N6)-threonylcarbamoyltransferase complex ATPase subunit type 1 TsaE [Rhodocyclaceae bacterium]|nr:tRNA (adenosine(37)-N6)-threonylcarbamoyltransferase complex ATPase subunit type 1 TsaE [Rhodocyclaceae bacterium]